MAPNAESPHGGASAVVPKRTRRRTGWNTQLAGPPPPSLYPRNFEFISSDPIAKQQPDTRAFIRSYVMRGKNTKRRSKTAGSLPSGATRPSVEEEVQASHQEPQLEENAAAAAAVEPLTSHQEEEAAVTHPSTKVTSRGYARAFDKTGSTTVVVMSVFLPAPVKAPHDLSLWNFSHLLDHKAMLKLNNFFCVLKETMYPVEWCFLPDSQKSCWFEWLSESESYLYSVLLTVSCVQDMLRITQTTDVGYTSGRLPPSLLSARSRYYMRNTITHLQQRLNDPETSSDDITVAIIIALANIADVMGEAEACRTHVDGLKKIVKLRGGIKAFDNTQLISKISRIDLGWALKYGVPPEFIDANMSWEPHLDNTILLESPVSPDATSAPVRERINGLDPKLRNIFADLQAFASVANKLVASRRKLRPDLFQEIMLSIQYRLMLLEYDPDTQAIEEAVRLGLLAFQTSVFVQMKNIRVKYESLMDRMKRAVNQVPETSPALVELKLWILYMGAIALFDPEQFWLEDAVRRMTKGRSWDEVHGSMRAIMWIDLVHDAPGRIVYESARSGLDDVDLGLGRDRTQFLDFLG